MGFPFALETSPAQVRRVARQTAAQYARFPIIFDCEAVFEVRKEGIFADVYSPPGKRYRPKFRNASDDIHPLHSPTQLRTHKRPGKPPSGVIKS
jgi:hypothetical protein